MTTTPGQSTTAAELLDGLSEAEWEYAWRFADHLWIGERSPDASGFDPERVAVIERELRGIWNRTTAAIRRRGR